MAWQALADQHPPGSIYDRPAPRIVGVSARRGKQLRAEPVVQALHEDLIRLGTHLPELVDEYVMWQPTSTASRGRIDASVHLSWALLKLRPDHRSADGERLAGMSISHAATRNEQLFR